MRRVAYRGAVLFEPHLTFDDLVTVATRMVAPGRRSDDDSMCTLVVVYENDDSWSFHGLGAPGVKVSGSDATALAQGILKVAT